MAGERLRNRMAQPPSASWWIPGAIYYGLAVLHGATFLVSSIMAWAIAARGGGWPSGWHVLVLVVSGLHAIPLALMDHEAVKLEDELETVRS